MRNKKAVGIGLCVILSAASVFAQVTPAEAEARLRAKAAERATAATQPVTRSDYEKLEAENRTLRAQLAKAVEDLAKLKAGSAKVVATQNKKPAAPVEMNAGVDYGPGTYEIFYTNGRNSVEIHAADLADAVRQAKNMRISMPVEYDAQTGNPIYTGIICRKKD